MAAPKIVLVTGANKGLGLAIVSVAGTRDPSAHYILACRDPDAGAAAISELKKNGKIASLELLQLEVTKDTKIAEAVKIVTAAMENLTVGISLEHATTLKEAVADRFSSPDQQCRHFEDA